MTGQEIQDIVFYDYGEQAVLSSPLQIRWVVGYPTQKYGPYYRNYRVVTHGGNVLMTCKAPAMRIADNPDLLLNLCYAHYGDKIT